MKKVHSLVWSQVIDVERRGAVQPIVRTGPNRDPAEVFVLDGPFTESKESCIHVAILARMATACGAVH